MVNKLREGRETVTHDLRIWLVFAVIEHISEFLNHAVKNGDCDLAWVDFKGLERVLDVRVAPRKAFLYYVVFVALHL